MPSDRGGSTTCLNAGQVLDKVSKSSGSRNITQSAKYLPHKDPSPTPQDPGKKLGVVACNSNPTPRRQRQEDPSSSLASQPSLVSEPQIPGRDFASKE